MKKLSEVVFFIILLIAALSAQTMQSNKKVVGAMVAPGDFYDFQRAEEDSHIEQWDPKVKNECYYMHKSAEHFGLMILGHGDVAVPLGYGKFQIVKDGKFLIKGSCPGICGKPYRLEGCAFNNCHYQIRGKKINDFKIISPWIKVGDFLHVYNNPEKLAKYHTLILECRHLSDTPPEDDDL